MKKHLTLAVALAASAMVVQAADYTFGGLSYNVTSDVTKTVCVVESSSSSGDVVIPAIVTLGGTQYAVTEIGKQAFAESELSSVVIPESIIKIDDGAFKDCANLKRIRFDAVKCASAGTSTEPAFLRCTSVTSVVLGDNVTIIPPHIFRDLSALRSISVPRNITEIGERAFANCSSVSEIYFDAAHCSTVSYPFDGCTTPYTMVISDNVEEIPGSLCVNSSVASVTVGRNVKNIKAYAFGTSKSTLESVYYNAIDAVNASDTRIFSASSGECTVKKVVLGPEVKTLPIKFMSGMSKLTTVEWNNVLEEIGDNAFEGCGFLSFKAPATLKKIGDSAMPSTLLSVDLNEGLEVLSGFTNSKITEIKIPSTVKEIRDRTFNNCTNLTKVEGLESDKIEIIGNSAFSYSNITLDRLKFGENLKTIGSSAFSGSKKIRNVILNEGLTSVGEYAFANTNAFNGVDFKLPESIETLGTEAFSSSGISGKLIVPESLKTCGFKVFAGNQGIAEIYYNANANCTAYKSTDPGVFYQLPVKTVIIGENVKVIGNYMFADMTELEEINLPSSVTSIGSYAFRSCTKLAKVNLGNVVSIGDYAFNSCDALTEIDIPESVSSIGGNVFSGCTHLVKVDYNAKECTSSISFPSSVTKFVLGESVERFAGSFFSSNLKWVKWNATDVNKYSSSGSSTCPLIVGENVKTVVGYTFPTIISNSPIPPKLINPRSGATAYVPDKNAYKNDSEWSKYILKQYVTWTGTIDGQKLNYTVDFPYELTLSHFLDNDGNIMPDTPKEIGKYKAVFSYAIEDDVFELVSPLEIYTNTANTMFINPFRTHTSCRVNVPVEMVSEQPITSFQLDLYLPEGLSLAVDEYGDHAVDFTDRKSNSHTISTSEVDSGKAIRIGAVSMRNQTFSGLDGAVINLAIDVADDAPLGDAVITLRNIRLVEPSTAAEEFFTNRNDVTVSIGKYLQGDTNDDGSVTVADVVNTVNMVLGIQPDTFVFDSADLVKDGQITISDVVAVMNIAMNAANDRLAADVDTFGEDEEDFVFYSDDALEYFESVVDGYGLKVPLVKLSDGKETVMSVEMENADAITAFQFDILLPEGLSIPEDEWGDPSVILSGRASRTHMLLTREQPDGALRIASYSSQNSPFRANSGEICEISLKVDADLTPGEYEIKLSFIEMSSPAAVPYRVPDFNVTAVVGATGIEDLIINPSEFSVVGGVGEIIIYSPSDTMINVHNLAGSVIKSGLVRSGVTRLALPAGFYLVNGHKLIVK